MGELTLTIRLTPQGLQLAGSTQDRLVLYGLLEMAKDAVRQHQPRGAIEIAGPGLAEALKRQSGG